MCKLCAWSDKSRIFKANTWKNGWQQTFVVVASLKPQVQRQILKAFLHNLKLQQKSKQNQVSKIISDKYYTGTFDGTARILTT